MIIEIFFIYIMVVLVAVIIKAIGKVGSGNPPCKSFEDLKEQVRKNREETRELKAKIKAGWIRYSFPKKSEIAYFYRYILNATFGVKSKSSIFYGR